MEMGDPCLIVSLIGHVAKGVHYLFFRCLQELNHAYSKKLGQTKRLFCFHYHQREKSAAACAFSRSLSQDDFEYAEDLHVFFNEMEKASGTVVPACCYVDEDGIVRMAIRTSSMEIVRSRAITSLRCCMI
uniref:Uncharacterized protein n=1 Tax=Globodera rostochiensis TaxID=31243 RepID=A0A914H129_GLORO